jgi:predicted nucleic acid-binding protein
MIGLDTTFLIDFLRGYPPAVSEMAELKGQSIVTTQINVYEVLVGLNLTSASQKHFDALYGLLNKVTVLTLDAQSTALAARLFGERMRRGERVEQNDCIIAGILKSRDCRKIVTRNAVDFRKLGFEVEAY